MCKENIYDFLETCSDTIDPDDYRGNVLLIVNITTDDPNAEEVFHSLHMLNEKYKAEGLRILCFPCFQFGRHGTRQDILEHFAKTGQDIGEIFSEVEVSGSGTCDIYKFLKTKKCGSKGPFISENFTYFLVDRRGNIWERLPGISNFETLDYMIYQIL